MKIANLIRTGVGTLVALVFAQSLAIVWLVARAPQADAQRAAFVPLAISAIVLVAAIEAAGFYLLRRIVAPITQLSAVTAAMAAGDTPDVPHRDRSDELGEFANAIAGFGAAVAERHHDDAAHFEEQQIVNAALGARLDLLRQGDLAKAITDPFPPAYEALRTNFNEAVDALRTMVRLVSQGTSSIDGEARQIAAAADDLARRTEASAANLEHASIALQNAEERVRAGLEATNETMARAGQAIGAVTQGRANGEDAAAVMDRVAASADNIGSVIEGLDKIAFQTRVLAMNAAVEAGRAGESGRGFAVVADLVSALAQRAEEEAKRVRGLISATREDIGTAVGAVHRMDQSLLGIATDVEGLFRLLERLQLDSTDQARTMSEIATTMRSLDTTTQQNAAMVEQTSAAARKLSTEVSLLARHAEAFKWERRQRVVEVDVDRRTGDSTPGRADDDSAGVWKMDNRYALTVPAAGASIH